MPSNSFYVKPFDPLDFPLSKVVGVQGWSMFESESTALEWLNAVRKYPAYTAFLNDEVVGAAGVVSLYRGVGEAWAIVLPEARQCARRFHKAVCRGLRTISADLQLHRIEATVQKSFTAGRAWAVSLGFKPEGVRRKASVNKEDLITFAMFPGGD